MRIIFPLLLLVFLTVENCPQGRTYTLSGVISEAESGEVLIGAYVAVYKDSLKKGNPLRSITSNKFGFYSLPAMAAGKYYLYSGALGFETFGRHIEMTGEAAGIRLDIHLKKIVNSFK